MIIGIPAEELRAFLKACPDSEEVTEGEYVLDLYDAETPMSYDILVDAKACRVLAARRLQVSEEEDGWYLGEEVEDQALIESALHAAMTGET